MEFGSPWFLSLLLIIPFLAYYRFRKQREYYPSVRLSIIDEKIATPTWRVRALPILTILELACLALFIIALARPREVNSLENRLSEGLDIMLTMDISSSMLARDFKPDRLTACKEVAAEFVDKRKQDRIGLVAFSAESYTACPLTGDHKVLKTALANIYPGVLEDGTAIGMGLAIAVNRLKESKAKSKIIILLTDGVNNAGYADPLTAASLAKTFNIKVYTIGAGTEGEAQAPIGKSHNGEYVFGFTKVEIDEELLKKIASETGGKYFRAVDKVSLEYVYSEIDKMEKTSFEVEAYRTYNDRFLPFLRWGLICLVLSLFLKNTFLHVKH